MKRFLLILLVLLLLLSACGRVGLAVETTTAETTALTTTEAPTTTEMPSTVEAEMTWYLYPWGFEEIAILGTSTLIYKTSSHWAYCCDIWMRDSETGEETLLLEAYGEEEGGIRIPAFGGRISERYFVYMYGLLDTDAIGNLKIYDVVQMRTVELEGRFTAVEKVEDGKAYVFEGIEGVNDPPIFYFEISALDSDGPIAVKALEQ